MVATTTVDCLYMGRPEFAAAYLLAAGDEAAFIDNNTTKSVPLLLDALATAGLQPEQVRYIIITHVHLDHAGGTAALAEALPEATVVAHPRAAPHVIDPERIIAGASAVYGAEKFADLYGEIRPVSAARVMSIEDEERLAFGAGALRFLHTRGHANHHACIVDESNGTVFTGDAFGLHYPVLQAGGTFALPSTSPTDFDGDLARDSVRRIVGLQPDAVYPTHYGEVTAVRGAAEQLLAHLDFSQQLMLEASDSAVADDALVDYIKPQLREFFTGLIAAREYLRSLPEAWDWLALDLDLNAQGLAFAATKRRRKARA